jgi:hypothetical protein
VISLIALGSCDDTAIASTTTTAMSTVLIYLIVNREAYYSSSNDVIDDAFYSTWPPGTLSIINRYACRNREVSLVKKLSLIGLCDPSPSLNGDESER